MINPCEACAKEKLCSRKGKYVDCPKYREWINWNWAMFRGWPDRQEKHRMENKKIHEIWKYAAPYMGGL